MKIQYLGTGAYEGIPAIFCNCEVCKKSRKNGGKNIMTRSQAIVDDRLLIDFPADTYYHSLTYGIDLTDLKTCIITHDHSDHFYPQDLPARTPGFGIVDDNSVFTVYGSRPTIEHAKNVYEKGGRKFGKYVDVKEVVPFVTFEAEGFLITPLNANHAAELEPVFYSIEKNGKNLLYAHDTGYFPDETWEYLINSGKVYNFVSLDCTSVFYQKNVRNGHMSFDVASEVRDRLLEIGVCDQNTKFCLNHFSHNGKANFDDLYPIAKKNGFDVSYDGMVVEF